MPVAMHLDVRPALDSFSSLLDRLLGQPAFPSPGRLLGAPASPPSALGSIPNPKS